METMETTTSRLLARRARPRRSTAELLAARRAKSNDTTDKPNQPAAQKRKAVIPDRDVDNVLASIAGNARKSVKAPVSLRQKLIAQYGSYQAALFGPELRHGLTPDGQPLGTEYR